MEDKIVNVCIRCGQISYMQGLYCEDCECELSNLRDQEEQEYLELEEDDY